MSGVLETILMIVLIMLAASAVYAVWAAVGTMRSVSTLADDLDDQLIPFIAHAESTLDAIDREVDRVDGIVAQIEEVSDTVSATTRAANEAVRKPLIKLAGVGGGVRGLLSALRRR